VVVLIFAFFASPNQNFASSSYRRVLDYHPAALSSALHFFVIAAGA
jgi:hypothetical protein